MEEQSLVSIILPTFNRENLVSRAIFSVINQSYENWELIIVDDCSEDNSITVIERFLKDNRLKLIRNKKNLGGSGSRNVGIEYSKGDFITFLDSDDEYLPDKVKLQVNLFKNSKINNLGVVNCGRFDERNGKIYSSWLPKFKGDVRVPLLSKDKVGANTSLLMVTRKVLENNIRFDNNMPAGQDWDFLIRVCLKFNMDFVNHHLVIIHHHNGPRVYNNVSAINAYHLQLEKYSDLIRSKSSILKKFLIRKALVEFSNNEKILALKTINVRELKYDKLISLWRFYFKNFKDSSSIFSKIFLKFLLAISFEN